MSDEHINIHQTLDYCAHQFARSFEDDTAYEQFMWLFSHPGHAFIIWCILTAWAVSVAYRKVRP